MLGIIIHKWNDRVVNLLPALKRVTKMSNSLVPFLQNCCSLGCLKNYLLLGMQLFPKADHWECVRTICFWLNLDGTLWTWGLEKQLDMSTELPLSNLPATSKRYSHGWNIPAQNHPLVLPEQSLSVLAQNHLLLALWLIPCRRFGCMWLYCVGEKKHELWGHTAD